MSVAEDCFRIGGEGIPGGAIAGATMRLVIGLVTGDGERPRKRLGGVMLLFEQRGLGD